MPRPADPSPAARDPRTHDLRITEVVAHPLTQRLPRPAVTSWGSYEAVSMVLVEVRTDAGVTGVGECLGRFAPGAYAEAIHGLYRPRLVGQNPLDVARLGATLRRALSGRAGGMQTEALAGVDIALWDILGKVAGLPVHRLLGGMGRTEVPAYASSIGWEDDRAAEEQLDQVLGLGLASVKAKVGQPVRDAIRRIELLRRLAGDGVGLSVDANWAYSVDEALVVGRALEANGYLWFEEPIRPEDTDGYLKLAGKLMVPLAAGESDYTIDQSRPLIAARALSVIQPDVARSGGISGTLGIARLAQAFDVGYAPHVGFSGIVCEAASLQLAAAMPNLLAFECCWGFNQFREDLSDLAPSHKRVVDGKVPVPQGPGLGLAVDWDAVRAMADQ